MKIKLITTVILLTGLNLTCKEKPYNRNISEVIYEASTRGFMLKIKLTDNLLSIESSNEREPRSLKLSEEKMAEVYAMLNDLELEKLYLLERPSSSSEYDAAPMAYLRVTKDGKTYDSSYFDHGNPPDEIRPVVSTLIELADID